MAELAQKNARFKAIDRAIGKNSLKVVTLLRLSPLLPLALSNYLYGLTSVDLPSYVLGSWAGMLPGTIAYVAAGPGLLTIHAPFYCFTKMKVLQCKLASSWALIAFSLQQE